MTYNKGLNQILTFAPRGAQDQSKQGVQYKKIDGEMEIVWSNIFGLLYFVIIVVLIVVFLMEKILKISSIVAYRRYRYVTVARCWKNNDDIGIVKIGIAVVVQRVTVSIAQH